MSYPPPDPNNPYPPMGGYPPQQGGYPPQQQGGQQGYPPQQGGYPNQQGGYPPQQPGYPPQGGYPPQQGGQPPQYPGYPPQQGGHPPQQPGYPPQQPGYPPQQPGYPPQQPGYPPQQPGYPPQQPGYPKNIQFEVTAWPLFKNFPTQVSIPDNQYVDALVRQACQQTSVSYNNVIGLKIKPNQSSRQMQKAEMLPPNLLISQVSQTHQKGQNKIIVHLDLMPQVGMLITPTPKLAVFDIVNIASLQGNIKAIGEQLVAFMNSEGGMILLGADAQYKIKGMNNNNMKNPQMHQLLVDYLKPHVHPPHFEKLFKTKVHPVSDANGQKTAFVGVVLEVNKWVKPDEMYSFDYVFIQRQNNQNQKLYPHEVLNVTRQRKGKQGKTFQISFG